MSEIDQPPAGFDYVPTNITFEGNRNKLQAKALNGHMGIYAYHYDDCFCGTWNGMCRESNIWTCCGSGTRYCRCSNAEVMMSDDKLTTVAK